MERFFIVVGVVLVAAFFALLVQRRRPEPPTQARWPVPAQIDRADFDRPGAPWLVVVFSSSTCLSCRAALEKAEVLAGDHVAVQDVDVGERPDLHRRYGIDAVPVTVVAD